MFDPGTIVLEGEEVRLRPLTLEDAPLLAEAAATSRDSYGFTTVPDGPGEAKAYIERALAQRRAGERYPFAVFFRGELVGSTSYCDYQPWTWAAGTARPGSGETEATEIGHTWLGAAAQRTRCNTEAKYLLLRHAFESWRVLRVSFRTDMRNERSRRAIERLGATYDGVLRAHRPGVDGTVRDTACYAIMAADWPWVRQGLREMLARTALA